MESFKIETQRHCPMELQQSNVTCHRVVVNIGQAHFVEIKRGNVWERKRYNAGDFSIIPYGRENIVRWFENIEYFLIFIDPDLVDQLMQSEPISLAEHRGISDKAMSDFAGSIIKEMEYMESYGKIYTQSLAICLAIHLGSRYQTSGKYLFAPKGKLSSLQLKSVLEYCNAFLKDDVGLDDLANLANLSPFHFARSFKNTVGLSPHQFVLQMKVERAKRLMKNKDLSLTQVAYELGFADQAHFSKAFKKVAGLSPRQFLQA